MVAYGRTRNPGKIDPLAESISYKTLVLSFSPAGFWMFDETSGTTATDLSGNGKHLTLTSGPVLTAGGPLGRFCEFDGSNDYATGAGIALTGEWSAVAIVRIDAMADRQIVGNWDGSSMCWILGLTSTGIEMYSKPSGFTGFGATTALTGVWSMVGCSRRSGTGASSLYRDGGQIGTGTVDAVSSSSSTEVGRKSSSVYINGGICGVAVFPTALTTAQHLALAQVAGLA